MSEQVYVTSDLHFGHDREFIWKARGYNSVDEMNEDYVHKWNITVDNDDDVYVLGDLMLGDKSNIEFIKRIRVVRPSVLLVYIIWQIIKSWWTLCYCFVFVFINEFNFQLQQFTDYFTEFGNGSIFTYNGIVTV